MSDASDSIKRFQKLDDSANETELSSSLRQLNKDVSKQGTTPTMPMPNTPLVHYELNITHGVMIATFIDSGDGNPYKLNSSKRVCSRDFGYPSSLL
ncbi:hypothetical protein ACXM0N_11055 [Peribacillus simplex]